MGIKKYIQTKSETKAVKNGKVKTCTCHIAFLRKVKTEHEQSITINITRCDSEKVRVMLLTLMLKNNITLSKT